MNINIGDLAAETKEGEKRKANILFSIFMNFHSLNLV